MALWNTFSNPAAGPSLFERMGVAGHGNAASGGAGGSTSPTALRAALGSSINTARSQAAAAVDSSRAGIGAIQSQGDAAVGSAKSGINELRSQGNAGIASTRAGIDDLRAQGAAGIESVRSGLNEIRTQGAAGIDSMRGGLDAILAQQPDVDRAKDAMYGAADSMTPIADDLKGYGDSMWESGTKVTNQALATLGVGMGFLDMDDASSPIVAEALDLYRGFDPDKYVAAAKQDVQASVDNQRAQSERNLARRGVDVGSGAFADTQSAYDRLAAVAAASAMTRARERGKTEQAEQFQKLLANNANTFLQTGGQLASIGASGQGAAVNAQRGAADVLGTAGGLYGSAGNLGLAYGNALRGAYSDLGNAQLNYGKALQDAYGALGGLQLNYGNALSGAQANLGNAQLGFGRALQGAYDSLAGTQLNYGKALGGAYNSLAGTQMDQAKVTNATEGTRVSAMNGNRSGGRGATTASDIGRHIGIGGQVLETGNDKVDSILSMVRNGQMDGNVAAVALKGTK